MQRARQIYGLAPCFVWQRFMLLGPCVRRHTSVCSSRVSDLPHCNTEQCSALFTCVCVCVCMFVCAFQCVWVFEPACVSACACTSACMCAVCGLYVRAGGVCSQHAPPQQPHVTAISQAGSRVGRPRLRPLPSRGSGGTPGEASGGCSQGSLRQVGLVGQEREREGGLPYRGKNVWMTMIWARNEHDQR